MGMACSERVQRMVSELRQLSDEEFSELEAEPELASRVEIERRAGRVVHGEETGLTREQLPSYSQCQRPTRAALSRMR